MARLLSRLLAGIRRRRGTLAQGSPFSGALYTQIEYEKDGVDIQILRTNITTGRELTTLPQVHNHLLHTDPNEHVAEADDGKQHVLPDMKCIHHGTLFEITPKGGVFSLPRIDGEILVPEGAISTSTVLEVGIFLIGERYFSEEVTPVSYALRLHLRNGVELNKEITINLPHYLVPQDGLELGLMKGIKNKEGELQFKEIDCKVELTEDRAIFSLKDLCYKQLIAKVRPEEILQRKYCICPVLPSHSRMSNGEPYYLYFCVAYADTKLQELIDTQCQKIPSLTDHHLEHEKIVYFQSSRILELKDLNVTYEQRNDDYQLLESGPSADMRIHPQHNYEEDVEYWTKNFIYPPNYKVQVCATVTAPRHTVIKAIFSTMDNSLTLASIEVFLRPPSPVAPSAQIVQIQTPVIQISHQLAPATPVQGPHTLEYTIFRKHCHDIIIAVKNEVRKLCTLFFEKGIINESVRDSVENSSLDKSEKTRILVYAVCDHIKKDRNAFYSFLKISKHHHLDPDLTIDLEKIRTMLIRCILKNAFETHRETLIQDIESTRNGLTNVVYFLQQLGLLLDYNKMSANNIIDGIINKIDNSDSPYQLFKDACTALKKVGIHSVRKSDVANFDTL